MARSVTRRRQRSGSRLDGAGLSAPDNWADAGAFPGSATSPAWATVTFPRTLPD